MFPRGQVFLRPMRVASDAEAFMEAKRINEEISNLQLVADRDVNKRISSPNELARATRTWMWITGTDALLKQVLNSSPLTEKGDELRCKLKNIQNIISDCYLVESPLGKHLTDFGAVLYDALTSETFQLEVLYSQATELYLRSKGVLDSKNDTSKICRDTLTWSNRLIDLIGDKPLNKIDRKDVQSYIDSRTALVKTTTIRRELNTLQGIWTVGALEYQTNLKNPFSSQDIPNEGADAIKRESVNLIDTAELLKHLHSDNSSKYVPVLAIMLLTGMRNNEAIGLNQRDYNKNEATLLIRENEERTLKTANSTRRFPVLPELAFWLDRLFSNKDKLGSSNSASASMGKYLSARKFNFTAYALRHGFRDRLSEKNTNPLYINELLGWAEGGMIYHYGGNDDLTTKKQALRTVYREIYQKAGIVA